MYANIGFDETWCTTACAGEYGDPKGDDFYFDVKNGQGRGPAAGTQASCGHAGVESGGCPPSRESVYGLRTAGKGLYASRSPNHDKTHVQGVPGDMPASALAGAPEALALILPWTDFRLCPRSRGGFQGFQGSRAPGWPEECGLGRGCSQDLCQS